MRYVSTRGLAPAVSFFDAVLAGLAPDGGLYVPEDWPAALNTDQFRKYAATAHFSGVATKVLSAFAGEDLSVAAAAGLANEAYAREGVWPDAVTPLTQIGPGQWVLELFHGPSLSFKDVAMQLIGPLFDHILAQRNQRLTVLCATSGDTGGAAVEALKGRSRVDLFVLLPKGRVSDVQRYFMTASGAENVHAIEIDGDFDACQALVKQMLGDAEFAKAMSLSGVNSINWARIVAQSVYFHIAANTLAGGPVNFAVPTGNLGDAFSGNVAKQCGAPIGNILLATNANDLLARAIGIGRYERAPKSLATLSPAMDIQVASNFERALHGALDRKGENVRRLYDQFAQSQGFDIPAPALTKLRETFASVSVSDAETKAMMKEANEGGYLACPHTAVALRAQSKLAEPFEAPLVTLATAHPAKFPDTVKDATGVSPPLPAKCADLLARKERIDALPDNLKAVMDFISTRTRALA